MMPEAWASKPVASQDGNKYFLATWRCVGADWAGCGLAVPGQPVVDVVQISTQEY